MSPHRLINIVLACVIAAVMSASYLLDGPSEIETMRSIQADLIDAQTMGVLK